MKKNMISGMMALFTFIGVTSGCRYITADNLSETNSGNLPEPIAYYGDIELFSERMIPLNVKTIPPSNSNTVIPDSLNQYFNTAIFTPAVQNAPQDIRILINSDYREITPAPQCRMSHTLKISVIAKDGKKLMDDWEHKAETLQAYPTAEIAKEKLNSQLKEVLSTWTKNDFNKHASKELRASILRFKMSRKIVEFDPVRFEKDLKKVLAKLRQLNGIVEIQIIEINKEKRIASFRILYRGNINFKNELQKEE